MIVTAIRTFKPSGSFGLLWYPYTTPHLHHWGWLSIA